MINFKKTIGVYGIVIGLGLGLGLTACTAAPTQDTPGQKLDSSILTTQVQTALKNVPQLAPPSITVTTYQTTVQLSGFVNSAEQSALAEQAAEGVPGVTDVKNDLVVKSDVN